MNRGCYRNHVNHGICDAVVDRERKSCRELSVQTVDDLMDARLRLQRLQIREESVNEVITQTRLLIFVKCRGVGQFPTSLNPEFDAHQVLP